MPAPEIHLGPVDLVRVDGWSERLAAFIERRRHTPFKWGEHDCGLFAADAALEITGQDLAEELRGYHTALGASRALARCGCTDVTDVPVRRGLVPRLHVVGCARGDVVAWRGRNGVSLGVVLDTKFAVPGEHGLVFLGLQQATKGWRL